MILLKKGLRAIGALAVVWLASGTLLAQSLLNFPTRELTSIAVTNTSSYSADVKFTLYNSDGSQATSALLNPVSRRVPPKGQIAVVPSQIFRLSTGARQDTWIQASSSLGGLEGFYFSGDFASPFTAGGEAAEPQTAQSIPYLPSDSGRATPLLITNPAAQPANVAISFFNAAGAETGARYSSVLAAHAQTLVAVPVRATSVRVSSDIGILATAPLSGQGGKAQGMAFVAPFFKNGENTRSQLVLMNSTATDGQATVSFFADSGSQQGQTTVPVKANGSASPSVPLTGEGWALVESDVPVSGMVVVSSGDSRTALSLQLAPSERMFFSRSLNDGVLNSTLNLVGTRERDAVVTVTFNRPDGTTIAKKDISLYPMSRVSEKIRDLMPLPEGIAEGYVTVQSSAPIYANAMIGGDNNTTLAGLNPQDLAPGFQAGSVISGSPRISVELLPASVDGVKRIGISGQNIDSNATLIIGGRAAPMTASGGRYTAEFPDLEWGYVNVKVRVGGVDSNIVSVPFFPDDTPFVQRSGHASYQKIEVGDTGLDLNRTVMVPIRHARVEVFDAVLGVVSVSETDEDGAFRVGVPENRNNLLVRVHSRLRSSDVKVLDNTSGNRPYILSRSIDPDNSDLDLVDTSRQSGAFNILDTVQRGNAIIGLSDPPPLTIFWSDKNNEQLLSRLTGFRTTFFSLVSNSAFILGDRNTDSDEFDDSVILHEYAHMLAARFSREDSPGGPHVIGDILDPRLAWSEGWANFFSAAARGTSIYVDSKGPGMPAVRYDLEDDSPPNDRAGYWSEASVAGLLWDLLDDNQDNVDTAQFPFATLWTAFTDLRNVRYVYLPYFLETFLTRNSGFADALRSMVIRRGIDFQPDVRPSVVNPFPRPIAVGETRTDNNLDSFTSRRPNLANSSHFWSFSIATAGTATVTLNIDGLGPANNPNANDLDLYLYDGNARRIEVSNQARGGQPEIITGIRLAPGTYYIEVRSFYMLANAMVFNSGRYRLSVQLR